MLVRILAALVLIAASGAVGCVLGGSDCSGACDKVRDCKGLNRTFLLDCSPSNFNCAPPVSDCADCIQAHSCAELISVATDGGAPQGVCDGVCVP